MHEAQDALDEATIAAYLAGTLAPEERDDVERMLTRDAEARELLCMAQEAMDAALDVPDASTQAAPPAPARLGDAPDHADRPPARRQSPVARFSRYAGIAVVVFVLGLSLRLVLGPPDDVIRSAETTNSETTSFAVTVATPDLHVHWDSVPDAYVYQVTVWNPAAARLVAEYETRETQILPSTPFMQTLRDQLDRSQEYTLRVEAFNAEKRSLVHFSTPFQLSP